MLVKLNADENNSDSLPWINEYLDEAGEPGDSARVLSIKRTTKGFLVLCTDFKGFIYSGSNLYKALDAAIPVWKNHKELPYGLFGVAERTGKISIAMDNDFTCVVLVDKKGNCEVKLPASELQSDQADINPFLEAMNIPPTTESRTTRKRNGSTPQTQSPI